ncbi:MAG: CPBP family intramembrane glutamic endopeptidase [Acidobacteriota bacterium]
MKKLKNKELKGVILFSILTIVFNFIYSFVVKGRIGYLYPCLLFATFLALILQTLFHRKTIFELGLFKPRLKTCLKSFLVNLIFISLIIILDLIFKLTYLASSLSKEIFFELMLKVISSFFLTSFLALFTEELAFRGYLIDKLKSKRILKAIVLSSIVYGLWHLPFGLLNPFLNTLEAIIYSFNVCIRGFLFGYYYTKEFNLIPPALGHGIWDTMDYYLFGPVNGYGLIRGEDKTIYDGEFGLVGLIIHLIFGAIFFFKSLFFSAGYKPVIDKNSKG